MTTLRRLQIAQSLLFALLIVVAVALPSSRIDIALAASGFVMSGVLLYLFDRRIETPLRNLSGVMERRARGDRKARILPTTSDAIGQLIHAFNQTADYYVRRISKLRKSQVRYASVFRQTLDGVVITKQSGRVISVNPAASRMLHVHPERAKTQTLAEVVRHHEIIDLWNRSVSSQEIESSVIEIGSSGQFWQVEVGPYQEGGARGRLVVLHDLTPLRRLETVRRDFISNISHELRTPLASLRAVVETLQDGAMEEPPVAQRFLERAVGEIDTMTHMIEELLELVRIESGKVPFRFSATSVNRLLDFTLERMQPLAKRKGITIEAHMPDDLPPVLADSERVQQTLANLLHNAIKFSPEDSTITLSAETQPPSDNGRFVRITVADVGHGIAAEDLSRIFERFYKTDRARTRSEGGTGLGLAIAKHIVQSHGGNIWAESKLNKGSSFHFTLPVA